MMHLQSQTDSHSCLARANAQLITVHISLQFLLSDVYKEHHEKHNAGYYPDAAKKILNNFLSLLQCTLIQCQTNS